MNRTTLISAAIIITLIIAAVWVYLLFFGTPNNTNEVFTNLGFTPTTQPTTVVPSGNQTGSAPIGDLVDTNSQALNQLTTRPVAGFTTYTATSGPMARYVERGTGHVFDLNLTSGRENRVSPTTIPQVSRVVFSDDPDVFALQQNQTYQKPVTLATLADGQLLTNNVSANGENLDFRGGALRYTTLAGGDTVGYSVNTNTTEQTELFSFAFAELDVWWGDDTNPTYLATKPASNLATYVYQATDNSYERELPARTGLVGFSEDGNHIITYADNGLLISRSIDSGTEESFELPIVALGEKCIFDNLEATYLWCAAPFEPLAANHLNSWYKGVKQSNDALWLVNLNTQTAELVANPEDIAGRPLDIVKPALGTSNDTLFFIDRTDHTLWSLSLVD